MSEYFELSGLKLGEIGEIVELVEIEEEASLTEKLGIAVGMPVIVLQKAAAWLVQIGGNQMFLGQEVLRNIIVRNSPI